MKQKFFFSSFGKSLFILWLGHIVMDFFTGIWPIYKTIAKIDIAQAGLIIGLSGFIGEIMQLGFGYFCDRGHRKFVLMLGIILASSIIWITFTSSIFSAFWVLLLLMLGSGSFHPAGMGYAGSLSQGHKGKTILLFASGGALGLGVSQLVFTKLFYTFNGNALVLFIPVLLVLTLIFFHKFPDPATTRPPSKQELLAPFMKSWKPLSLLYMAQITNCSVAMAFLFLLPDLMISKTSSNWLVMGGAHLCFILGSAMALPPAGYLCDKFGQKKVLTVALCGSFFLLYLLLSIQTLSPMYAALLLLCFGGFLQSINPIVVSWGHKMVPDSPSTVSALLMGFAWCFTNFGPTCAGYLCKTFHEEAVVHTLSWMGVLLLFSLLFVVLIPSQATAEVKEELTPDIAPEGEG